jgi:flagellar hook-associated protein 1
VAFGLNSFFTGSGAADIALRADIAADPQRLSASASGAPGDNGALLALLELQGGGVPGLGGASLSGFYGGLVASLGHESAATQNTLQIETFLMDGLLQRRDQVSGVNIDEELVNMIQFEQTYQAASRYIQVVSRLGEELLALI